MSSYTSLLIETSRFAFCVFNEVSSEVGLIECLTFIPYS